MNFTKFCSLISIYRGSSHPIGRACASNSSWWFCAWNRTFWPRTSTTCGWEPARCTLSFEKKWAGDVVRTFSCPPLQARECFRALDEAGLRAPLPISHGKVGLDTSCLDFNMRKKCAWERLMVWSHPRNFVGYRGAGALHDIINLPVIFFASIHLNNDRPWTTIADGTHTMYCDSDPSIIIIFPGGPAICNDASNDVKMPWAWSCRLSKNQKDELGTKHVLSHTQSGVSVI